MNKLSFFTIYGYISFVMAIAFIAGWLAWKLIDGVAKPKQQYKTVDMTGIDFSHKKDDYAHEETAPAALLQLLYDERGKVHECNDGRISRVYFEERR